MTSSPAGVKERARPILALAVTAAATVLAVLYFRLHAPWRDELQAWALVRGSDSLSQLWTNLQPESHPLLWYLILSCIQKVSLDPRAMALVHSLFAVAAIWLLMRYSPLRWWNKILIVCSYYLLYQYFAIARAYVLVELFAFAICIELQGRRRAGVLALLLVLLAQTEIFGAILGTGLCAAWLSIEFAKQQGQELRSSPRLRELSLALAAFGASALFCIFQCGRRAGLPVALHSTFRAIPEKNHYADYLIQLLQSLLLFTNNKPVQEWVTTHIYIYSMVSLLLLLALTLTLYRSREALALWLVVTGLMLILGAIVRLEQRHLGMLSVAFVVALWLATPARDRPPAPVTNRSLVCGLFVSLFFAQQAWAGVANARADLIKPASASRATARYLQEQHLVDVPMICDLDYPTVSVLALIDRGCFFPSTGRTSRFTTWGPERTPVTHEKIERSVARQLQSAPAVLLLMTHPIWRPIGHTVPLAEFEISARDDEVFYIYRITR